MNEAEAIQILTRKRLLIFDWDGTVANSAPLHSRAFNEAFASYGITVDYASIAGMTTSAAVNKIAGNEGLRLTREQHSRVVKDKQSRARRLIEIELEPIGGSIEFIRRAGERFKMSLCTSASRRTLEPALRKLTLTNCFDSIFTAEDVQMGKPAPEMFLRALAHHSTEARAGLVFEDSDSGIAAATSIDLDYVRIVGRRGTKENEATWRVLNRALARARS